MLETTIISHLIKPEDLQHHGTLFAGRMAEWFVETCFIAACRLISKPQDIVCVQIHGINFRKPANNGDIIEIKSKVAYLSRTRITVHGQAFVNQNSVSVVSGFITFVTVDNDNRPYAHGFILPESYIAENKEIYEEARRIRT